MSEPKNDGGPAFPLTEDAISYSNRDFHMQGMSLRDYFKAKFLAGPGAEWAIMECPDVITSQHIAEHVARMAGLFADAMLAERAKP